MFLLGEHFVSGGVKPAETGVMALGVLPAKSKEAREPKGEADEKKKKKRREFGTLQG